MGVNQATKGKSKVGKLIVAGVELTQSITTLNQIGAAVGTVNPDRIPKVGVKAIAGAALHAGVLAWQNPEASAILITRIVFDVTTVATGACTMDIGTTATSATTASDNLLDGIDVNAAIAVFDNADDTDNGTNGKTKQKLASAKWVTFKEASGNSTGLVANAYIHYVVV